MKVTSIDLYSDNTKIVSLNVTDPDPTDSYILKGSVGLDAGEIVRKFKTVGLESKNKYHELVQKPKDVVFKIGLNPNYKLQETNSDLRDELYRSISLSSSGLFEIRFANDTNFPISMFGHITKFEASLFTNKPEILLTLRCEDPMLRSKTPIEFDVSEFSLTDIQIDDFVSTAPHGFKFEVHFETTPVNPFVIQDASTPDWLFQVDYDFGTGDILYFSSETNNKYLYVWDGLTTQTFQLVDKISPNSIWPIINPGINHFHVTTTDYQWDAFSHYPTFWGV